MGRSRLLPANLDFTNAYKAAGVGTRIHASKCVASLKKGKKGIMPSPGVVSELGSVRSVIHEMPDGTSVEHRYAFEKMPVMYWDEKRKAIYIFSRTQVPRGAMIDIGGYRGTKDEAAYIKWMGRRPTDAYRAWAPKIHTHKAGSASHIEYASDKFSKDGSLERFAHPFDVGVEVALGPGMPPQVIYISGGALRVTPRGLEG